MNCKSTLFFLKKSMLGHWKYQCFIEILLFSVVQSSDID